MIFNSFITQIGMLVLAVGIIFTYVQPTFAKIGVIQTTIAQYQEEQQKVNAVNGQLASLVAQVNVITTADMRALMTYMPDTVDHVAISRDIFTIAELTGVYLESVSYDGALDEIVDPEGGVTELQPTRHGFSANVSGTYDQVKSFLQSLEQNNYPLEVQELTMAGTEIGLIKADLVLITYSHTKNI